MTQSRGIRVRRGSRTAWVAEQQGQHFCGCGCGEPVQLRPEHFNIGIPGYLHGHNTRVAPTRTAAPKPQQPCECGCGEMATPGKRYISGHNSQGRQLSAEARQKLSEIHLGELNSRYGKRPPNYRGWYRRAQDGYIVRSVKNHPFAPFDRILEHRLVLERHLRKTDPASPYLTEVDGVLYLRSDIQVHHKDEVRDNNKVGNLQPMTPAEHTRWHQQHRHRHPHK